MRNIDKKTYLSILLHPIQGVIQDNHILLKLGVALGSSIINYIFQVVETKVEYLVFVFLLLILDFLSGLTKALRRGGIKEISSIKMRATLIKFVEYSIFLIAVIGLTNTFAAEWNSIVVNVVQGTAFFIVCIIEITSIVENLGDWADSAWKKVLSIFSKNITDVSDIANVDNNNNKSQESSKSDKG